MDLPHIKINALHFHRQTMQRIHFEYLHADSKIVCVRVTFHWESWELNPDLCCEDLKNIAESADKYGIMCIYDNHQWECSSWIGCGVGMPNSLMSVNCKKRTGWSKPDRNTKENFWRNGGIVKF